MGRTDLGDDDLGIEARSEMPEARRKALSLASRESKEKTP